jgi:hypothetical protein
VRKALQNGHESPKDPGRHLAVDQDFELQILNYITSNAQKYNVVSWTDIVHDFINKFETDITKDWVDSFIIRHETKLFEISSSHQEHPHFTVLKAFFDAIIEQIKAHCIGLQAEFIFTLDDVGISIYEWEDRKPRNAVIPVAMKVTNSITEQIET